MIPVPQMLMIAGKVAPSLLALSAALLKRLSKERYERS
jgi:hypothetical protein